MSVNPYAEALAERDPVEVLAAMPERLAKAAAELSTAQMETAPAPGKWSVREVLAHLADCEIAFGFRLRQTFAGARAIQPFDQDAWARSYGSYPAALALATFRSLRDWNLAFIRGLSDADKRLRVTHPERGEMALWTIVETMAGHDLHHLTKLEGAKASTL